MQRYLRMTGVVTAILLLVSCPVFGAGAPRTLAVLPFENTSVDRTLTPIGDGIAETLMTVLGQIRDFTLVERGRLNDVLKEIKLSASGAIDTATAQRAGKLLGVDAIVVGSFQKAPNNDLRMTARIVDVESGNVRTPILVDGAYNNLFKLQDSLAAKLVEAINGSIAETDRKQLASQPGRNIDAFKLFSEGLSDLRKDLFQDSIEKFDRALSMDPRYAEANFYRGMALSKIKRWDDAVAAFKRALPQTQRETLEKWTWSPPCPGCVARDWNWPTMRVVNLMGGFDVFSREGLAQKQGNPIYMQIEPTGATINLIDLKRRTAKQVRIPEPFGYDIAGFAPTGSDAVSLVFAATTGSFLTGTYGLYAIDNSQGKVLWRSTLTVPPLQAPLVGIGGDTLVEYLSGGRLVGLDSQTNTQKWERTNVEMDLIGPRIVSTKAYGSVLVAASPKERKVHAIRLTDGKDAWTADLRGGKSYQLFTEQTLVVFEPDDRVFAIDLESRKLLADVAVKQSTKAEARGLLSVPATIAENTLFFQSDTKDIYAIDVSRNVAAANRSRWKRTVSQKVLSFLSSGTKLLAGTDTGDILVLDSRSGDLLASAKIADKNLVVDYASDTVVVASTTESLFGLDPKTGEKRWEYGFSGPAKKPVYFKSRILLQTPTQLFALDTATGRVLWQYTTNQLIAEPQVLQLATAGLASVFVTDDSLFLLRPGGISEYSIEQNTTQGITDKEVLTELASTLLEKGDVQQAAQYADRVAQESDPNYPPLRYVQARLDLARGNVIQARQKLADYASLVGRQSSAAQEVIADFKRDSGLRWQTEIGPALTGSATLLLDGKLLNIARVGGRDSQLVALDANSGRVLWRQPAERFLDVTYDIKTKRVFYARGSSADPKAVQLFGVDLGSGVRTPLASLSGSLTAGVVTLGYANGRLYLASLFSDLQEQKTILKINAFNASSGKQLWEKTHESTANLLDFLRNPLGVFEPHSDYFAYSVGKDVWILRGEDGTIDAQFQEPDVIDAQWRRTDGAVVDPDLIIFKSWSDGKPSVLELAQYSLSGKKVVRRIARVAAFTDPYYGLVCPGNELRCGLQGASLLTGGHSTAIAMLDLSADSPPPIPEKWKVEAGEKRVFVSVHPDGDVVWASRSDFVMFKIDRNSGKVFGEYEFPLLWTPSGGTSNSSASMTIENGRAYLFTADGLAYSLELKPIKR